MLPTVTRVSVEVSPGHSFAVKTDEALDVAGLGCMETELYSRKTQQARWLQPCTGRELCDRPCTVVN